MIERAIDTLTGADPLSLYRKDRAKSEQIEAQQALNRSIQQQDNALSTMKQAGLEMVSVGADSGARSGAHDRQGDLAPPEELLGRPPRSRAGVPQNRPARKSGKTDL